MNETEALAMIRKFMSDEMGIDPDEVVPAAHLREDLGLDSLDAISLIEAMQDEYKVRFAAEELESMATVGDLVAAVQRLTKAGTSS
jgi:acyl carrier protein